MFAALLLLAVASWLGSIYIDPGIQNLLSADGLRWMTANIIPNLEHAPWMPTLLTLLTLSVCIESGLAEALRRSLRSRKHRAEVSLRNRRALQWTALLCLLLILTALALTFLPPAPLLSAYGTFRGSPLQQGVLAVGLSILFFTAWTYGALSGRILSIADLARAAAYLPARFSPALLSLVLAAQVIAQLDYVFPMLPEQPALHAILRWTLFLLPIGREWLRQRRHKPA